jgi:RNA polymerase sigma factor (sigma-70 family)
MPTGTTESQALADEVARGRSADRDLAARLERPGPAERATGARAVDTDTARDGLDRAVLEAAKAGDQRAREKVVDAHLPLIAALARRFAVAPQVERLELIQEGVAGLLQALERFDPERGVPLWAYARPTVERSMRRLVAELGDAVELSDRGLRHLSRLRTAEQDLMREHRRLPSRAEIIERSGVARELAEQLFADAARPRSMQEPITTAEGDVIGLFGDLVDDPSAGDAYDQVLDEVEAEELLPLLSVLSERERSILEAHYGLHGEPQSHKEIAERLGLSTSRVRQLERRALNKLRRAAEAAGLDRGS